MKLKIQKREIENVLIKSIPFLDLKDVKGISSNLLMKADSGIVEIRATDFQIGLISTIKTAFIIDDGIAILNGKKFLDIVKILKDGDIDMEIKKDCLNISQGKSSFKVPLIESKEYPSFPEFKKDNVIKVDSSIIIDSFRKIISAIDVNNPKFELTGVLIDFEDNNLNVVSTDTRRLSIVSIENVSDSNMQIIIPKKAIIEMQKTFSDDIEIYYDDVNIMISSERFTFFSKLINGKFPNFKRIIPDNFNHRINLNKLVVIDSIKQVLSISTDMKMIIKSDSIVFESLSTDNSEAVTLIEIDTGVEEDIEICLNIKYFSDFLNVIFENNFEFCFNESSMPIVLESDNFKTIIMPIIL